MQKRYVHPDIGHDPVMGQLVSAYGSGLAVFYMVLLGHADDQGVVACDDTESLRLRTIPAFAQYTSRDIDLWLTALHNHDRIFWDQKGEQVLFPPKAFYTYQDNIDPEHQRTDHPERFMDLPYPRGTDAETWRTIDEVWSMVPGAQQNVWTRRQVREAIEAFPQISTYDAKMAMLSVLEKFDGRRNDIGFLFGNAIKWRAQAQDEERLILRGYTDPREYEREYRNMIASSAQSIEDRIRELEREA